jgi:ketosteroid isomerase-like protein
MKVLVAFRATTAAPGFDSDNHNDRLGAGHHRMKQNASRQAVQEAADQLIAAFSNHDTEKYFAAFDEQATFLFHNLDRMLKSRAEYEALWQAWEDDDQFRVLGCRSSNGYLQLIGDVAIFTHDVSTDVSIQGRTETSRERETIVFARQGCGRWLGVHEHLSKRE